MPLLVQTASELEDLVASVSDADRYAIDTEFHRERTYFPQAALIQIAWADGLALVDPLAVDMKPMATVLDGPGLCVLHAGVQDLEVLDLVTGTVPQQLFDTQIAAGFLGLSNGSLKSLLDRFCNVSLPKGDRLTDWLQRPLT
ncbi:MAG: ribonuclease D, partial [Actinomycetota bacterium]